MVSHTPSCGYWNRFLYRRLQCASKTSYTRLPKTNQCLQLFAINLTVIMLGIVYWQEAEDGGVIPHQADTAIKVATSAGAIFGQCIFGYLGDRLGRKRMYGVELMIIIATTLAQSLCGESSTLSIVGVLIFYRVVMGIGVGGDCRCNP